MSKKTINEALKMIGEGFIALSEAYVDHATGEDRAVLTTINTATKEVVNREDVTPNVAKEKPQEEPKPTVAKETETLTKSTLEGMSYLDIKNKAKDLGLKAVGSKKSLIEAILGATSDTGVNTPEDEVEAPTEAPEEIEEDTTEIEEDEELELEEDEEEVIEADSHTLYDQVVADLEDYTNEELADILSEIGISPKGKRQALLAKIVQAIEEGKLEWEEDEEETTEATETKEETEVDDEEETFKGTSTRLAVIQDYYEKLEADFEDGTVSDKTILKFLKSYYNDKYTSCGRQADFEEYARIQCELVDDDGELHSLEEPYFVAEEVYCCGETLKEVDNDLYCEHCGTTYENDND